MNNKTFEIHYISTHYGVSTEEIIQWVDVEILRPCDPQELLFDDEDLQRIQLICELRDQCNPNIESLQVILHLIDQLNFVHNKG